MPSHQILHLGANICWTLFFFAIGACVGSLTNVLVYRLPLGLGVVTQGSRCPACGTRLTWRENIPVFGWLFLRGKCRFCKSSISPEYPMVEMLVGVIFASVYVLWYWCPSMIGGAEWLGVNWAHAAPEWATSDRIDGFPRTTWGPMVAMLVLLGSLVAMTLVDAKTFTIPLQIPWFATVAGVLMHTLGAAIVGPLRTSAPGTGWSIPIPGGSFVTTSSAWFLIGGSLGAVLGLVVSNLLLHYKLIRRSFEDYQQWEDAARAQNGEAAAPLGVLPGASVDPSEQAAGPVGEHAGDGAWIVLRFTLVGLGVIVISTLVGWVVGRQFGYPPYAGLIGGVVAAPLVAALIGRVQAGTRVETTQASEQGTDQPPTPASAPEMWVQYPHARREMLKELLFLTPVVGLGWLGGSLASWAWAGSQPAFWLLVLCGTIMGYLVGGGIVWLVRIGGSLAFGKEAMGLGDVHLMAAVGACTGWMDAALAFPLAAFVGLYWLVVSTIRGGGVGRAMPFGPYLALATVLVVMGKPLVELGLSVMMGGIAGGVKINLP